MRARDDMLLSIFGQRNIAAAPLLARILLIVTGWAESQYLLMNRSEGRFEGFG